MPLVQHHHDPATLFAGKLHAILQREYLKGRDVEEIYEIVYMLTLEKLRGSINKKYAPKKKKS